MTVLPGESGQKGSSLLLGLANKNPSPRAAGSLTPSAAECREERYHRGCRATGRREPRSLNDQTEISAMTHTGCDGVKIKTSLSSPLRF